MRGWRVTVVGQGAGTVVGSVVRRVGVRRRVWLVVELDGGGRCLRLPEQLTRLPELTSG
jgi:hypothetical protein